jgi:hypothetical protein
MFVPAYYLLTVTLHACPRPRADNGASKEIPIETTSLWALLAYKKVAEPLHTCPMHSHQGW